MVQLANMREKSIGLLCPTQTIKIPNITEVQKAGYSLNNLLIANFLVPATISPLILLQITKPLIAKKIDTPNLPRSTQWSMSYHPVPLAFIDGTRINISATWSQMTSKAAIPLRESISNIREDFLI